MCGLLSTLLLFLDVKSSLHGAKWHILLYTLATAMTPRFLSTVDEEGTPISVEVRVGQAVETVGQAGRPKTITGFQTHTTPVLVSVKDRAGERSMPARTSAIPESSLPPPPRPRSHTQSLWTTCTLL